MNLLKLYVDISPCVLVSLDYDELFYLKSIWKSYE